MSSCDELGQLLEEYVDGEIDDLGKFHVEAHVVTCTLCHDALEQLYHLRVILGSADARFALPASLRKDVHRLLLPAKHTSARRVISWLIPAGAGAIAASLVPFLAPTSYSAPSIEQDLVESHVRSLQADHLLDASTSSEYSIGPWFSGRLDFAPRVPDPGSSGFRLLGCRLDYASGHSVAAIVYAIKEHKVNVFVWPAPAARDKRIERQGYSIVEWSEGELRYAAVGDASAEDLLHLRRLFETSRGESAS